MAKTIAERLISALTSRGAHIVPSRSGKVITLTRPHKPGTFYFVGKAGSLRKGTCYSKSTPASLKYKQLLLEGKFDNIPFGQPIAESTV